MGEEIEKYVIRLESLITAVKSHGRIVKMGTTKMFTVFNWIVGARADPKTGLRPTSTP